MKASNLLILLISAVVGFSCKKSWERPGWDSKVVAPLVSSSLSIDNIIRDTSKIKIGTDNTVILVNRDSIGGISLDTLVALNTPTFEQTRFLDQVVLDTRKDTTSISLGQIFLASSNPLIKNLANADGATINFPITVPPTTMNNVNIDINSFFQMAKVKTGNLHLEIFNGLPLNLTNVTFDLKNKVGQEVIISRSGIDIPILTRYETDEDLAGDLIEGALTGSISFGAENQNGFVIDTSAKIKVILTISGITVDSARAIFPAQRIVDNTDKVILLGMDDVQLTYAKVASGFVVAEAVSTIEDSMFFQYNIPGATQNGVPFVSFNQLPPAPANGNISRSFQYDFSGFELDLTGLLNDTVNTFVNQVIGDLKYSGNLITLSLTDSIQMLVATKDLVPSYVRGYLGRDTINIGPSTIDLPLFNNIVDGTLNFEEADLKLSIENGMGMPAAVKINSVSAKNTKTGATAVLGGPNIGIDLPITAATDNPHTFSFNLLDLSTAAGHNAQDLLNVMPDQITYSITVVTNPSGATNLNQFAYLDKTIRANLDLSIPLSIISNNLTLMDTVAMNPEGIKERNITSGNINVVTDNGFPIEAELEMYLMDANYTITDTLRSSQAALAAPVNGLNRVISKQRSVISFEADETKMTHLYDAKFVVFKAKFNTDPSSVHLKIYSDYSIDFKIVGDVNYRF